MSKHNRDQELSEKASDNSRNNNGTLGSDGGVKHAPKGSFHEMTERVKEGEPANERGIRENEENHAVGNVKYGGGKYVSNEIDPNKPGNQNSEGKEIEYPKKGYNHVENTGGTSEEELNDNNES
jgi:hypothetical protein